jgi:hypothetical protein
MPQRGTFTAQRGIAVQQNPNEEDHVMSDAQGAKIAESWETDPRWQGVQRTYSAGDVDRLRGTVRIEYTLARMGAERRARRLDRGRAVLRGGEGELSLSIWK